MTLTILFLFFLTGLGLAVTAGQLLGLDLSRYDKPITDGNQIGWLALGLPSATVTFATAGLLMLLTGQPLYWPTVWLPALLTGAACGLIYYALANAIASGNLTGVPDGAHPGPGSPELPSQPRTYSSYTRLGLVSYTLHPTTGGQYPLELRGTVCYGTPQALDMLMRLAATARDLRGDGAFAPEDDYQRGQIEMIANTIHSLDGDGDACRYFVQWLIAGPEDSAAL